MAFIFLRREHLVRHLPQARLQLQGVLQQPVVAFAALLKRGFHGLAPHDAPLQLAVGGGQFRCALSEQFGQFMQMRLGLSRRLMSFLNRRDGFGKKNLRPCDEPVFFGG